jgi:serine/threonine-protein kinase
MEQIRRIAVLPLSVAGIDTLFVDGINDELVQTVSRIEGLTLIARGSVTQSAAESTDPVVIGKALGVQALLTGAVRRSGEHTVVALRLLSAADASILWSYDAQFDPQEVAGSQGDIAAKLAMHLSARLRTAVPQGPRDPATYALYLRARHYWNQRTAASLQEAIRLFEQALAAEPDYAEAQVGLAETWLLMPMYANTAPFDSHPKARAAAEAALKLNPESSRAHMVLAVVSSQFDWDWPAADEHFRRAIALDPNNATAYQWRGESLCYRRQFDRCEADLREALALDPLSPILATAQGIPARFSGDTAKARRIFAAALQKHPNFVFADFQLGLVAVIDQRWDEAIERLERVHLAMGPVMGGAPLAFAYARAGRAADALRIRHDLERLSAHQYVAPLAFSDIAMGLGDHELALAWLGRAMAVHDDFMVTVGVDHHHFDLHDDARFQEMMRRVGTPL